MAEKEQCSYPFEPDLVNTSVGKQNRQLLTSLKCIYVSQNDSLPTGKLFFI